MANEPITTSRIDIVGDDGVCRATLTATDDFEGQRIAPFAGLIIRDRDGRERGGIGVIDIDGETRIAQVLDHPQGDAVGTMVTDSGEVLWTINDAPDGTGIPRSARVQIRIDPDGSPTMSFNDAEERPRLRFSLTENGAGTIEFLRADGSIAQRIVPEEI